MATVAIGCDRLRHPGVNREVVSDVAAPFSGVKDSELGREGGSEGIEEYLDTKYIALQ